MILLVAAVSIGGVAAFVGPKLLRAGTPEIATEPLSDEVALGVKGLIESAAEVLAIQPEPLTGDTFVVLWGGDTDDHDAINRGEIIVLHYSTARQVLSAWICAEPKDVFGGIGEKPVDNRPRRVPRAICQSAAFGSEWTQSSDVERRIIGTGVRSFRFDRDTNRNQRGLFRIALTRAASETDGQVTESEFQARSGAVSTPGS